MKDSMIDMMLVMMPYMKPFMWFGAVVALIGALLLIYKLVLRSNGTKAIAWSQAIVFITALFFLMAQAAGVYLSMSPTVNFGDSSKFEFNLVSFWQIGLAFLIVGFIMKFGFGKAKQNTI